MTAALATVAIETDRHAAFNRLYAGMERRRAAIMARIEEGFVLQYDNGLCVGADRGIVATGFESAHIFKSEVAAKAVSITNGNGEKPEVVTAAKARYRALGKLLSAMQEMADGMN